MQFAPWFIPCFWSLLRVSSFPANGKASGPLNVRYYFSELESVHRWYLEKEMAIHSSTLAWKSHGRRSLMQTTEWLHFHFHMWYSIISFHLIGTGFVSMFREPFIPFLTSPVPWNSSSLVSFVGLDCFGKRHLSTCYSFPFLMNVIWSLILFGWVQKFWW